jgi:predicted ABC-type transport system involved in lysophospholipase L1 biosynthesis ATPase subunit
VSVTLADRALAACRRVTVVFGHGDSEVRALSDVDLAIHAGQRVGLVGRSGSGKTTLLHVLGGLATPTRGQVLLGGEPLGSLDAAARGRLRARTVVYVFQGSNLLPSFTAFENVAFAEHVAGAQQRTSDAAREDHGEASARLGATDFLGLVGLHDKLDALPSELSGGEAQRVALARALAQRPDLLLCDEPTGQLDSDTGTRVLDLVEALHSELGFALVTATHDPHLAARAERIVTLDAGRIVADEQLA